MITAVTPTATHTETMTGRGGGGKQREGRVRRVQEANVGGTPVRLTDEKVVFPDGRGHARADPLHGVGGPRRGGGRVGEGGRSGGVQRVT